MYDHTPEKYPYLLELGPKLALHFQKYPGLHYPGILYLAEQAGIDSFKDRYTHDVEGAVGELIERYYPDAWMFLDKTRPIGEWPRYDPVCETPAELALAYALRPDGIIGGPVLAEKQ